jgi:hypothetical protein
MVEIFNAILTFITVALYLIILFAPYIIVPILILAVAMIIHRDLTRD